MLDLEKFFLVLAILFRAFVTSRTISASRTRARGRGGVRVPVPWHKAPTLIPTVSITRVSPSKCPTESPYKGGGTFAG